MSKPAKLFIAIGLLCFASCGLGGFFLWRVFSRTGVSYDDGLAAYKRAGLPMSARELQPAIPPDQDAGPLLIKAIQKGDNGQIRLKEYQIWQCLHKHQFVEVQAKLNVLAPVLALDIEAAKRPYAILVADWDKIALGQDPEPDFSLVEKGSNLLAERAEVEAHEGNFAACDADLTASWRIGVLIGEQPGPFGFLSANGANSVTLALARLCAAEEFEKPVGLSALKRTVASMKRVPRFERWVRGDAFQAKRRFDVTDDMVARSQAGPVLKAFADLATIAYADRDSLLRLKPDVLAWQAGPTRRRTLRTLLVDDFLPPFFGPDLDESAILIASERITTALVAVLQFHAAHGHWPASISELPDKYLDPFDGKPLRLRITKTDLRVYSIGPDMHDDGGLIFGEKGSRHGREDIVAQVTLLPGSG